jgi:hypothetical protein
MSWDEIGDKMHQLTQEECRSVLFVLLGYLSVPRRDPLKGFEFALSIVEKRRCALTHLN